MMIMMTALVVMALLTVLVMAMMAVEAYSARLRLSGRFNSSRSTVREGLPEPGALTSRNRPIP
jgi:hypothetical protein